MVGGGGVVGGELVGGASSPEPDATGAAGGGWGGVMSACPMRRWCIRLLGVFVFIRTCWPQKEYLLVCSE